MKRAKIAYEFLTKGKNVPLELSTEDFQHASQHAKKILKEKTAKQVKDLSQHIQSYLSFSDIDMILIAYENGKWVIVQSKENTHIKISEKNMLIEQISSSEMSDLDKVVLDYNSISSSEDSMLERAMYSGVFSKFLVEEKGSFALTSISRCRFEGIEIPFKPDSSTPITVKGVQSEQDGILIGKNFIISVEAKMENKEEHVVKVFSQLFLHYWRNKHHMPDKNVSSIYINYNSKEQTYYLMQVVFDDYTLNSMRILKEAKFKLN